MRSTMKLAIPTFSFSVNYHIKAPNVLACLSPSLQLAETTELLLSTTMPFGRLYTSSNKSQMNCQVTEAQNNLQVEKQYPERATLSVLAMAKQYEELHCQKRQSDRKQLANQTSESQDVVVRRSLNPSYYAKFELHEKSQVKPTDDGRRTRGCKGTSLYPNAACSRKVPVETSGPQLPEKANEAPSDRGRTFEPLLSEVTVASIKRDRTSELPLPEKATVALSDQEYERISHEIVICAQASEPESPENVTKVPSDHGITSELPFAEKAMAAQSDFASTSESSLSEKTSKAGSHPESDPLVSDEAREVTVEHGFTESQLPDKGMAAQSEQTREPVIHEKTSVVPAEPLHVFSYTVRSLQSVVECNSQLIQEPLRSSALVGPEAASQPKGTSRKTNARLKLAKRFTLAFGFARSRSSKMLPAPSNRRWTQSTADSTVGSGDARFSEIENVCETLAAHSHVAAPSTAVHCDSKGAAGLICKQADDVPAKRSLSKVLRKWFSKKFIPCFKSKRGHLTAQPLLTDMDAGLYRRLAETSAHGALAVIMEEVSAQPEISVMRQSGYEDVVNTSELPRPLRASEHSDLSTVSQDPVRPCTAGVSKVALSSTPLELAIESDATPECSASIHREISKDPVRSCKAGVSETAFSPAPLKLGGESDETPELSASVHRETRKDPVRPCTAGVGNVALSPIPLELGGETSFWRTPLVLSGDETPEISASIPRVVRKAPVRPCNAGVCTVALSPTSLELSTDGTPECSTSILYQEDEASRLEGGGVTGLRNRRNMADLYPQGTPRRVIIPFMAPRILDFLQNVCTPGTPVDQHPLADEVESSVSDSVRASPINVGSVRDPAEMEELIFGDVAPVELPEYLKLKKNMPSRISLLASRRPPSNKKALFRYQQDPSIVAASPDLLQRAADVPLPRSRDGI